MRTYLMGCFLCLLCFLGGCHGSGGTSSDVSSSGGTTSSVVPSSLTNMVTISTPQSLHVGTSAQYTVYGVYTDGSTKDITSTVSWTSSDNTIVSVDNKGVVQGLTPGNVTVQASSSGFEATIQVSVTSASLVSIQLTPSNLSSYVGVSTQYLVTGLFDDGLVQNVTLISTWSSSQTGVATINNSGLAVAVGPGTTTISAMIGTTMGSATLTINTAALKAINVTPAGSATVPLGIPIQFSATGVYSDGGTTDLTSTAGINWSSSATTVANINSTNGQVVGVQAGSAEITATFTGISGMTTAVVSAATPQTLVISPTNSSALRGTNLKLTASLILSDGSISDVSGAIATSWTVNASPREAQINNNGLLSIASNGTLTSLTVNATFSFGSSTAQSGLNHAQIRPSIKASATNAPASGISSAAATISIVDPTTYVWSYVSGPQTFNDPGVVVGSELSPPARANAASVVDSKGLFWMCGGQMNDGAPGADLWTYNKVTRNWTLVDNQVPSMSTADTAAFYDAVSNSIYFLGGWTINDYSSINGTPWVYDISAGKWSVITGQLNPPAIPAGVGHISYIGVLPPARYGASVVAAPDGSGGTVYYLFGGASGLSTSTQSVLLNDLWRYTPSTSPGTGAWEQLLPNPFNGSNLDQMPVRAFAQIWFAGGKIYIFGGVGAGLASNLNDLWSIDPTTLMPEFISGNVNPGLGATNFASYGQPDVPALQNTPGGRSNGASWTDAHGNLWMTSGQGLALTNQGVGILNDIWQFNTGVAQWAWMGGANYPSQHNSYPIFTGDYNNFVQSPSGRVSPAYWVDPDDNTLWLFGGYSFGYQNDLWHYGYPSPPQIVAIPLS